MPAPNPIIRTGSPGATRPASAASALAALEILEKEPERRTRLWKNANRAKSGLKRLGYEVGATESVIVPVAVGEVLDTFRFWKALFDAGVFTNPVIPPAVPEGECLIRTSYMATHSEAELDRVVEVFGRVRPVLASLHDDAPRRRPGHHARAPREAEVPE